VTGGNYLLRASCAPFACRRAGRRTGGGLWWGPRGGSAFNQACLSASAMPAREPSFAGAGGCRFRVMATELRVTLFQFRLRRFRRRRAPSSARFPEIQRFPPGTSIGIL